MDGRENYLDYVANRPGVKALGEHSLWDAHGKVPSLENAVAEVARHTGNVWTPVISLSRENAERLGYTDLKNWQELINASITDIAKGYKIHPDRLRWYAAIRLLAALAAACGIGRFSAAHAVSDLLQYVIIGHGGEVPVLPVHGAGGVDPGREDLVNVLIGNLIVGERLSCWNIRDQLRGGGHAVIGIGCGLFQVILISSLFVKWCVFPRGKCDRTCEPGRKNTVLRNIFENHS